MVSTKQTDTLNPEPVNLDREAHRKTVQELKRRYCGDSPEGGVRLIMSRIVRYRTVGQHFLHGEVTPWRTWFFMYGGWRKVREEALNCLPELMARVNKRRSVNALQIEITIDGEPVRITQTDRQELAAEHEGKLGA